MANMHLVTGYAGTSHVTAADQGSFNVALLGAGNFILNRGSKFAATIISNNVVRIADGDLVVQGRHVRIAPGTSVDLTISSGVQGYKRNDLIVVRYTKDAGTSVETCDLVVINGTSATGTPADPEYMTGDTINDNITQADFPLYRVEIDGVEISAVTCLFTDVASLYEHLTDKENPHGVTPDQIGAAKKVHQHTYDEITKVAITNDSLPVVSIAKGGTGASNGATGLKNLFAAGITVISSNQYGDTLPAAGTAGRIFFKKA